METVHIQSLHVAKIVSAFISAASPLNIVAAFQSAVINLIIADRKVVCQMTPRNAGCLMVSLNLALDHGDGVELDDQETEAQLYLESVREDEDSTELLSNQVDGWTF
jgi:hypothetical protein